MCPPLPVTQQSVSFPHIMIFSAIEISGISSPANSKKRKKKNEKNRKNEEGEKKEEKVKLLE